MRTNPPGVVSEEGEGKKPTVLGEPGGLRVGGGREGENEDQKDNRNGNQNQWLDLLSASRATKKNYKSQGNFWVNLENFFFKKRTGRFL